MDRHSSYTAPRSDRSPASRGSRRSPKHSNNGRSGNENRFLHNLLWYVLPFIVFNLLLLFLATASPRIELTVGDTTDYKTVDVSLKVKSLIPIRKLTTTLESQDIEFKKEGGVYHATLTNNGALEIYVEGWNGMPARQNEHIAVLDDTAPSIDEETVVMEDGKLELIAEDNISGINYEAVYATDDAGKRTAPVSYDKETGRITFDLEKGSLTVYLEDMAGNANQSAFSLSTSGIDTDSRETDFPEDGENGTNGSKKEEDKKTSNSDKEKTSKSTEAAKSSKTSKNTEASKSTKASKSTETAKNAKAAKSTEATKSTKAPKSTEATKSTKAAKNTETSKTAQTSKSSEAAKSETKASKNTETSKATSAAKATEASKPAEATKAAEASKATQESKPAESAPASETIPVIEPLN